jgi:hypothetical protein
MSVAKPFPGMSVAKPFPGMSVAKPFEEMSKENYVAHYTLYHMLHGKNIHVKGANPILISYLRQLIQPRENVPLEFAVDMLEKNPLLLKFNDIKLYDHQKEIFRIVSSSPNNPKLILYIAPTGTGKTLTPIGLSESKKIIFVCAARHIGMEFARNAIAVKKKIAFAFGCESPADIRLHFNAAKVYERNYFTGGIYKVDNSVGDKVEIIITDVSSYLHAMNYLLAFYPDPMDILTYWDEPTISMDTPNHPLHELIHRNWAENQIPNMVFSSATLPKKEELREMIGDFCQRFSGAILHEIISHECSKTIPLINRMGLVIMPHTIPTSTSSSSSVAEKARHCLEHPSLLRYLDLTSIIEFLMETQPELQINYEDLTMTILKTHYLRALLQPYTIQLSKIKRTYLTKLLKPGIQKMPSVGYEGRPLTKLHSIANTTSLENTRPFLYLTTEDAHTLTEGPTIYLTNQLEKMAKFYIQESKIPEQVMTSLYQAIEENRVIQEDLRRLEEEMENLLQAQEKKKESADSTEPKHKTKDKAKDKKNERTKEHHIGISTIQQKIEFLTSKIKSIQLKEDFVPNKLPHLKKWCGEFYRIHLSAYCPQLTEEDIHQVMILRQVEDEWKILLLLGIGVFTENNNKMYLELMKSFAIQQKLYLILAESDYLFGLNFQFCQGYIGKDLQVTQEKIIQCLGRIGRHHLQKSYSARFCEEAHAELLFSPNTSHLEADNMNRLFNSLSLSRSAVNHAGEYCPTGNTHKL